MAIAAFATGKHIFIEKPVCFSLEEIDTLITATNVAETVARTGYIIVFHSICITKVLHCRSWQ
ncbi:TPA: hypothetical protein EYN98_17440 [Candidatus Poribacteria bacterium]|nr:hypothetical protein [Candidatus Poribacteria bacterium]HIO39308.1 hypothetical protein [Rhodospirillales bacterium]